MYKLQVSSHTKMDAEKQFSAQEWTKILNFSLEQNQSFLSRVNFRYSNIPTLAEVVLFFRHSGVFVHVHEAVLRPRTS